MSEIDRDIDGMASDQRASLNRQFFPADKVTLDEKGKSFVYDFKEEKEIQKIDLFKTNLEKTSRICERDLHIYTKQNEADGWSELTPDNWNYVVDPENQSIHFNLKTSLKTRFIKIRTIWDDRDIDNNNVSDYVTFSNESVQKMIRIWTLDDKRNEAYGYDKNSNRTSLTENGKIRNYNYYKNAAEGNTARVMYDGKWWYTYDANGNRTARASNAVHNNNEVKLDKTCEYWEYTWDYHNRLIKVEQYNAPDNAQNVVVEYEYDALNRRIERTSRTKAEAEVTQYAYGRNGAITYWKKENSGSSRTFAYLNNQITAFLDKSDDGTEKLYYTVTDIQGSVTEVYDEEGFLVWKSGYTAFGIKAGETTNLIDFDGLYTGCDFDAETGLTYHWNRWRSEDGDSWLTQDPARDGLNWYGYAGQNPTNYFDQNGLEVKESHQHYYLPPKQEGKDKKDNKTASDEDPHITGPTETPSVQPPVPETPNPTPDIGNKNENSTEPDGSKVIIGISEGIGINKYLDLGHVFIMYINENNPKKSIMLDASGHYGGNRGSSDTFEGNWRYPISIRDYLGYFKTDRDILITLELNISTVEKQNVRDEIENVKGRSWLTCAIRASEVIKKTGIIEGFKKKITPKGLLREITNYAKKNPGRVIIKQYDFQTGRELSNEKNK